MKFHFAYCRIYMYFRDTTLYKYLNLTDNKYNIERLKANGANVCTTHGFISELLHDFHNPESKWFVSYLKNMNVSTERHKWGL